MDALREGAASLMCSYQRINNSYGCQNSALMNGVLKQELGFEGFVVCVLSNSKLAFLTTDRSLTGTLNILASDPRTRGSMLLCLKPSSGETT